MKKNIKLLASLAVLALGLTACSKTSGGIIDTTDPNAKFVTSVSLDIDYVSLELEDVITLTPTITLVDGFEGEYKTMWKSSRPNIAKVDVNEDNSATVTAQSAGTASISFIAGLKMATCTVVVHGGSENPTHEEEQPEGVSVTINIPSKTLVLSDDPEKPTILQLTATASDGSEVTWSSSDEEVAIVDAGGLVTALKAGTADIQASAGDKSATCKITVVDADVPIPEDPEDPEDDDTTCTVYFFLDYNNIDEKDETGKKLITSFKWYGDIPLSQSGKVPEDLTESADPAFPYFVGWSSHTIIDSADDLWNMAEDIIGNEHFFYLYGIWSDIPAGGFVK